MHVPWKRIRIVTALAAFLVAAPAAAQFVDVTDAAGLTSTGNSTGAAWGDFNDDGCVDLFITGHLQNFLYQNDCSGGFTDVAAAMGISGPGASRGVSAIGRLPLRTFGHFAQSARSCGDGRPVFRLLTLRSQPAGRAGIAGKGFRQLSCLFDGSMRKPHNEVGWITEKTFTGPNEI
jgi:hypothetical protein